MSTTRFVLPVDPVVREDGLCVVCSHERRPVAVTHEDPFCRMECCRAFHGIPLTLLSEEWRVEAGRKGAAASNWKRAAA